MSDLDMQWPLSQGTKPLRGPLVKVFHPGITCWVQNERGVTAIGSTLNSFCITTMRHSWISIIAKTLVCSTSLSIYSVTPALAGPSIFIDLFATSSTQSECLSVAKSALQSVGITDGLHESTVKDRNGNLLPMGWYGQHPEFNLSAVIECSTKNGIGHYGITGGNSEQTYDLYQRLRKIIIQQRPTNQATSVVS